MIPFKAGQGMARQGEAWRGGARQGKARQGSFPVLLKTGTYKVIRSCREPPWTIIISGF